MTTTTSARTPWCVMLSPAESSEATRAAEIGATAMRGLAQSAKAEALARMMAVLVAEVGASAAVSGLDFTQRDILLTRLEASVVDRARMLSALEASHG